MYKRVRIIRTGQVIDMVPNVADRMIAGGTAELVETKSIESQAITPRAERTVAPAQAGPARKTRKSA